MEQTTNFENTVEVGLSRLKRGALLNGCADVWSRNGFVQRCWLCEGERKPGK